MHIWTSKLGLKYTRFGWNKKISDEERLVRKRATFIRYYSRNKDAIIKKTIAYKKQKKRRVYNAKRQREYRKNNPEHFMRPDIRFRQSVYRAAHRNLLWNITLIDYSEMISKRCFYCDGVVPRFGCGLDRMDNSKGYLIGNVVPCCRDCNVIKANVLTFDEMVVAMNAIKGFRLKKALGEINATYLCEPRK